MEHNIGIDDPFDGWNIRLSSSLTEYTIQNWVEKG